MINEFLAPTLPPHHNLWFQQNGATAHSAVIRMAALRLLFPQRVISCVGDVPWPPRSPDQTTPDLFLWGYLKSIHQTPCRLKCTRTNHMKWNLQYFKRKTSISYEHLLNSVRTCVFSRVVPTYKTMDTKVKQCKTNLTTLVNCNVLKMSLTLKSPNKFPSAICWHY